MHFHNLLTICNNILCYRTRKSQWTTVAGPSRVSVRDGWRSAPDWRAETVAPARVGPDRVRQDDGGRRTGHAVRLWSAPRTAPDSTAKRGLLGRGGARRIPGQAPGVPVDVRTADVPGTPGQSAGRRRLAANACGPFPWHRRLQRPADVHQDCRVRRLITPNY